MNGAYDDCISIIAFLNPSLFTRFQKIVYAPNNFRFSSDEPDVDAHKPLIGCLVTTSENLETTEQSYFNKERWFLSHVKLLSISGQIVSFLPHCISIIDQVCILFSKTPCITEINYSAEMFMDGPGLVRFGE